MTQLTGRQCDARGRSVSSTKWLWTEPARESGLWIGATDASRALTLTGMETPSRRLPPGVVDLARAQAEVVSRAQLRRLETPVRRQRVRRQVEAERWVSLGDNVVALHTGTLTPEQRRWQAVLAQGEQLVALAGLTAASAQGLQGFETDVIHVVVPHGARVHRLGGVKVHVSRRFGAEDVHPVRQPPTVTVERAVIDAAVWSQTARRACALVAAAVQQRLTTVDRLLTELDRAGRVRHRRLLGAVLLDVGGGAHALSELDLLALCRRYDLPEPVRQVVRRDADGRRRWLDAVFRLPDGRMLVVEVDGAAHMLIEQYADDLDRTVELVIDGKVVVRVAAVTLRLNPERFGDQLRRLLRRTP
jgi:hypothetical protein